MKIIFTSKVRLFLKESFFLGLFFALAVFAWVRVLFYEIPFSPWEDSLILIKTILTAWAIMAGFKLAWNLLLYVAGSLKPVSIRRLPVPRWFTIIVLSVFMYSCNVRSAGFQKDLNTGLSTEYEGIVPQEALIVMNGEVLNHTDIPLGEQFRIINRNIQGLTVRNEKVSVGCKLQITDTLGRVLLLEPDLFAARGPLSKDSVDYLQCVVSTGAPMEWQQEYFVKVKFWDKYGKGKIENQVRITAIDEP